jgi:hypothetical protein
MDRRIFGAGLALVISIAGAGACDSESDTTTAATSTPAGTGAGTPTSTGTGTPTSTGTGTPTSTGTGGAGGATTSSSSSSGMGGTGGVPMGDIPYPGDFPADTTQWYPPFESNGTPATAFPVGVVSQESTYIAVYVDEGQMAFFVFRAGPALTQISVDLAGTAPEATVDFVHLHDGTDLMFGAEIPPIVSTSNSGTWATIPGNIYVLEIHTIGAGFV